MSSGCPRRGGLFALPGWATLAVLLAHHWRERGKRGDPVGAGMGKEEATDELC